MNDRVREFYDDLAADYHLIFEQWDASVQRQGAVLDALIRSYYPDPNQRPKVFDCSCGIGTQALGLALLGYRVHATDLSPKAAARARAEAERLGTVLTVGVADFRDLASQVPGQYDVVIACDNSLPHLLTVADMEKALASIFSKVVDGGLFVASIRDYDRVLQEPPCATTPMVFDGEGGRRIVFQVWNWRNDGRIYDLDHFVVEQRGGTWKTECRTTAYRAILRSDLSELLRAAGFSEVTWHRPGETGYYQPLVTAVR